MDWKAYRQYLMAVLPNAKSASGGKFINCRCQECMDSSNMKSAHMYIHIPWDNDQYSWYYCHKCHCSGYIDHKKLIDWGIYDQEIALELNKYNSEVKYKNPMAIAKYNRSIYRIQNNYVRNDEKTELKRQYISNRMGVDLSLEQLSSLKIVMNLWDLLKSNDIKNYSRDINIINDLDREFIGFMTIDNAFLNMRRTVGEGLVYKSIDKRYVNYQVFDKVDTSRRFYTIPTQVNLNQQNRIKFHIAEGPMDILSIYLNLRKGENGIYTSVTGSNYISVIMYFLRDLMLPNLEIHVYVDNDVNGSVYKMNQLMDKIPDKNIPFIVHRNMYPNEKDFGVPISQIDESIAVMRR